MKHIVMAAGMVAGLGWMAGCASSATRSTVAYAPATSATASAHAVTATVATNTTDTATRTTRSPQDEVFVSEVQSQMDQVATHVRDGIEQGRLSPEALVELTRERGYVERLIEVYGQDGELSQAERVHIATSAAQMREILGRAAFRRDGHDGRLAQRGL